MIWARRAARRELELEVLRLVVLVGLAVTAVTIVLPAVLALAAAAGS